MHTSFILLLIIAVTAHFAEIDPRSQLKSYQWILDDKCRDECTLSIDIVPNKIYYSCYFNDIFYWNSQCKINSSCHVGFISLPMTVLTASKEIRTNKVNSGYVNINIPNCDTPQEGDCLYIEISIDTWYSNPGQYYFTDSLIDCINDHIQWRKIDFSATIENRDRYQGSVYHHNAKLIAGCYSTEYNLLNRLQNIQNVYLQTGNNENNIKYYIGNKPVIIPPIIDDPIVIGLISSIVALSIIVGICGFCLYRQCNKSNGYDPVPVSDEKEDSDSSNDKEMKHID
jgi:hypothetical protein